MANTDTIASKTPTKSKLSKSRTGSKSHPYFVEWKEQNALAVEAFGWLSDRDRDFFLGCMTDLAAEMKRDSIDMMYEWEVRVMLEEAIKRGC